MAHCKSTSDRILTFEDMHVGATDRRRRDAQECVPWANLGNGFFPKDDTTWLGKNGGFHERLY